eukprot:gene5972-1379_t
MRTAEMKAHLVNAILSADPPPRRHDDRHFSQRRYNADNPLASLRIWELLRQHPPPLVHLDSKPDTPETTMDVGTGTPPSPAQTWAPIDKGLGATLTQQNLSKVTLLTLNTFHYSRFVDTESYALDVVDSFAEFLVTNGIVVFCLQDTKLMPKLHKTIRSSFQRIGYHVFFTTGESTFQCMTGVFAECTKPCRCNRGECMVAIDLMMQDGGRVRVINTYWRPLPKDPTHYRARDRALQEYTWSQADHNACILAGDINKDSCPDSFRTALATGLTPVHPEQFTNITVRGQATPDIVMISDHLRACVHTKEVKPEH